MHQPTSEYLHLGCGATTSPRWLNVDGSLNAALARRPIARRVLTALRVVPSRDKGPQWKDPVMRHDLRKPLPWADGTFKAVYASHTLEHLHLNEAKALLRECWRVLKPGGVCRMVVPDLEFIVGLYVAAGAGPNTEATAGPQTGEWQGADTRLAGDWLVSMLQLRRPSPAHGRLPLRLYRTANDPHIHKWMYDERSLTARFIEAGFGDSRRMGYNESRIDAISDLERRDRVEGGGLVVEGVKVMAPRHPEVTVPRAEKRVVGAGAAPGIADT